MRKRDWVHEDGLIATDAFVPDPKTSSNRQDGGLNWEDDSHAEAFTFRDQQNAGHGAARLERSDAEHAGRGPGARGIRMFCERRILEANPYHGNLVFVTGLPKHVCRQVAAALAMKAVHVPPPKR